MTPLAAEWTRRRRDFLLWARGLRHIPELRAVYLRHARSLRGEIAEARRHGW